MYPKVFPPQLDLTPLPQLPRIPRIPKRLPQPPLIIALPRSSWTPCVAIRRGCSGASPRLGGETRAEVDEIEGLGGGGGGPGGGGGGLEEVFGVEGGEERFEFFHGLELGELRAWVLADQ